jgi:isopenicillin-N epimerase
MNRANFTYTHRFARRGGFENNRGMPRADDATWIARRQNLLLAPDVVQLNAGTCSPTPRPVFDRVSALRRRQAESPTEFQWRDTWPLLAESRAALGAYVGAEARDIALVENVTVALNIVAKSLSHPGSQENAAPAPISQGDNIVTTDHEYGSMTRMWQRLGQHQGYDVRVAEFPERIEDPAQLVSAVEKRIDDRTRVLYFSHISSPSGLIFPAKELCALARRRGLISVIDGAHAPGHIRLSLNDLDADFYCANCHKWMMAAASVGFLHANSRHKHLLQSLVSSWGHGYAPSDRDKDVYPGTSNWHYDMEFHGTEDRCPQLALPQTIAFREEIGGDDAVAARVHTLTAYLRERMSEIGLHAFLPHDSRLVGNLTAFRLPDQFQSGGGFIAAPTDSRAMRLQKALWERHRIEVPTTFAANAVFLRVSTGWFNTFADIDALVAALRQEMRQR